MDRSQVEMRLLSFLGCGYEKTQGIIEVNPSGWTTNWRGYIMAKLTYEDKKEIVRLYDEEHRGYLAIAKRFNLNCSVIRCIERQYHIHGESSLKKKPNRKFTADLKLEIITRAINGESKSSLGIEYQIEQSMIINWLNNMMNLVIMVLLINRKEDYQL